jgi:LPS export ABC transporter protein LptC
VISHGAERTLLLEAAEARVDPIELRVDLELIHLELRSSFVGSRVLRLDADRARVDLRSDEFLASGHVIGDIGAGQFFQAESIEFDPTEGVIRSTQPVRVEDGGLVVEAGGIEVHLESEQLKLTGGVRLVRSGEEPGPDGPGGITP